MFELPNDPLLQHLKTVAFGTEFRKALDTIRVAKTGGLIVIGDPGTPGVPATVDSICEGGFVLNTPFSAARLAELSKMDGAVLVSSCLSTIRSANVHLTPHPTPTTETGMRHRTAECVARQIQGAVVIAISKRNDTITLFLAGEKYVLLDKVRLLAESSHPIDMAEFYGRGYSDAISNLLSLKSPDTIKHDLKLINQLRDKLFSTIWTSGCHNAELGTDGDIINARLTKVVKAVNVAAAALEQISGAIVRDRQTTRTAEFRIIDHSSMGFG